MDIWEIDKIFIFIAFVIPGFISIKFYQLLTPGHKAAPSNLLIDAISYSAINYSILLIPIVSVENSSLRTVHPQLYLIFYIFVLFLAPTMWAAIWKKLRESNNFQKNAPHPIPRPWDYVFSQRKPYWIKVFLKNGEVVAGLYAEKSFSSSSPESEQIYLQETWILNDKGGFERAKNQTAGIIILSDQISHIEFTNYGAMK